MLGMRNVLHHHIEWAKAGIAATAPRPFLFASDELDDVWMHFVGERGWIVFGQDYRWHREPAVLEAIRQHAVRAFYLWGASSPKWDAMRSFAYAYPKIIEQAATPGPYIFRVSEKGRLSSVPLIVGDRSSRAGGEGAT